MSGTTYDDDNRHIGDPPPLLNADFEADVQCAITSTAPVLITAPADVATEIARRIHRSGLNRRGPFVTLDCKAAGLPEQLAVVFDTASPNGTVFLRDVDHLAPSLQSLLYTRIVPLGVRVIAATSASLLFATLQETFDERLFYRLNQIHLVAPNTEEAAGAA